MFGRIFLARAYLAARPSVDWENAVDYGERVVDDERFLFSYCSIPRKSPPKRQRVIADGRPNCHARSRGTTPSQTTAMPWLLTRMTRSHITIWLWR